MDSGVEAKPGPFKKAIFWLIGFALFVGIPVAGLVGIDKVVGAVLLQREPRTDALIGEDIELVLTEEGKAWSGAIYRPWSLWAVTDFQGKYITVNGGFRVTPSSANIGNRPVKKVWFFGGSSMLGHGGSADDQTIPAHTCSVLNSRVPNLHWQCLNFGTTGYVNSQEVILLVDLLARDEHGRPDAVVFMDGANELYAANEGFPGYHMGMDVVIDKLQRRQSLGYAIRYFITARFNTTFENLIKLFGGHGRGDNDVGTEDKGTERWDRNRRNIATSARRYEGNMGVVAMLARDDFDVWFAVQPVIFDKPRLSEYERTIARRKAGNMTYDAAGEFWKMMSKLLIERSTDKSSGRLRAMDLTRVFESVDLTVFHDWVHYRPLGNRLLGEKIASEIAAASQTY